MTVLVLAFAAVMVKANISFVSTALSRKKERSLVGLKSHLLEDLENPAQFLHQVQV